MQRQLTRDVAEVFQYHRQWLALAAGVLQAAGDFAAEGVLFVGRGCHCCLRIGRQAVQYYPQRHIHQHPRKLWKHCLQEERAG